MQRVGYNKLHYDIATMISNKLPFVLSVTVNSNVNPFICCKTKKCYENMKETTKHNRSRLCSFTDKSIRFESMKYECSFVAAIYITNLILIKQYQYWNSRNGCIHWQLYLNIKSTISVGIEGIVQTCITT